MTRRETTLILPGLIFLGTMLILIGGGLFFASGRQPAPSGADRVTEFVFTDADTLPMLYTEGGQLLAPGADGYWQVVLADDSRAHAAEDARPTITLPDGSQSDQILTLDADHQALRSGGDVYISIDAAGWSPLESTHDISVIWKDDEGNLLAGTDAGVMRWGGAHKAWTEAYPTTSGDTPFEDFQMFKGVAFAVVNGSLLRYSGESWEPVSLGSGAVYLSQLEVDANGRLWLLDTAGERLWSTEDGQTWTETAIHIADSAFSRRTH